MIALARDNLGAFALFGAALAAAGLPIYIYAPPYYAENFGVSLTGIAAVLFWLRLFDAVQDPLFGWLSERLGRWRKLSVAGAAMVMALSMLGLFAVTPPFNPLAWFAITLLGLFSSFSFLTINFYAQGVDKATKVKGAHFGVAAWRETGALLGVCTAAVAPAILASFLNAPYMAFSLGFAGVVGIAVLAMNREWTGAVRAQSTPIRLYLKDQTTRRLLLLAFVNAMPVAVSSTMFLFFVVHRLEAPGWEGPLLVLFFLSGACSAPIWSRLADRFGGRRVLLLAMALAMISFGFTLILEAGDALWFSLICVAAGATIGADLTLLPALFAKHIAKTFPSAGQGFGLWSFVNKSTLAFAAIALFPILEAAGFDVQSTDQPAKALTTLTILYALVPLGLKLVAFCLALAIRFEEEKT